MRPAALVLVLTSTALAPRSPAPPAPETRAAVLPVQDRLVGGDLNKRYFLIGPRSTDPQPEAGYGLVVILPGGDGREGFQPWCRRIVQRLPPGYVGAQVVAPIWSEEAERVVWPTRQLNPDLAPFTTEDLVLDVVTDVRSRMAIDDRRVFALGWSSGGPPVYSAALQPDSVITGAFVAMSVFTPGTLPSLDAAKGRVFYILHSPEDWISFEQHARAAERALRGHGARVKLEPYRGGHGWRDQPLTRIRRGIEWLQQQE